MGIWLRALFKEQFDNSAWSGAASNWDSADAYCRDCLVDLNPKGKKKTKDKCHLPYRKPGSKKVNKGALRAMASGGRGIAKANIPAAEKARAARWASRLWPAAFGTETPPSLAKLAGTKTKAITPMVWDEFDAGSSIAFKETDQGLLFLGIFSNKFEDRETEIIEDAAHKENAEWVNSNDVRIPITLIHAPKFPDWFWLLAVNRHKDSPKILERIYRKVYKDVALGESQRVIVLNGFALVVGKVFKDKEPIARRLAKMKDLGMSHGFVSTRLIDNIVKKYRSFEFTILPRTKAANFFTLPLFGKVGGKNVNGNDEKFLLDAGFSMDVIKKLDEATEGAGELLAQVLNYKEVEDSEEEDVKTTKQDNEEVLEESAKAEESSAEESSEEANPTEEETVTINVETLKEQILAELDLKGLETLLIGLGNKVQANAESIGVIQKSIDGIQDTVQQVKETDDDKIARQLAPAVNWGKIGFSATQVKDNDGEESPSDEEQVQKLKGAAAVGDPEVESKIKVDRNNPLSMVWGSLLEAAPDA